MLFLFSTLLNKIFHITDVYIYSTKQINNWIHKKWPHSKVYIPLNLNNLCCFLDDPQLLFCVVIVVHEFLVGPEQFNCLLFFRKILQLLHVLWFSSIFCVFEHFPTAILRSNFSLWGQLRDSYTAITKGGNIYRYSRRQHNIYIYVYIYICL